MSFAVVACSRCTRAWSVDLRYKTASCPRCPVQVDLRTRGRLWQGPSAEDARQAAGAMNTALAQGIPLEDAAQAAESLILPDTRPHHDSPLEAAAAKARALANLSRRAETVALWLTRLVGDASDDQYMAALQKAGLGPDRAEKEIVRMLASDILFEPRAGAYRALEA